MSAGKKASGLRKERDREHLRNLLLDGAESDPSVPVDAAFFAELRERIRRRAVGRQAGQSPRTTQERHQRGR